MKYKRLSAQKHRQIIRCFCADITATACAEIVGVNRNTVNSWYNEFQHHPSGLRQPAGAGLRRGHDGGVGASAGHPILSPTLRVV